MPDRSLRLGTRASALAQWQANWTADALREHNMDVELVLITTQGDTAVGPLGAVGGQGLFTKEIQRALLDDRIDLAVHSLKDLPTETVDGLCLGAVPPRAACGDAFVSANHAGISDLPNGAVVGTGSLRRGSQLLHLRSDLKVQDIRGNVETRLKKLDDGQYDAIILAEAGLQRLGLADRIRAVFAKDQMLPAVGQGALGIEIRAEDKATREAVSKLDDALTHQAVVAERALLAELRGGCLAPVGAWARIKKDELVIDGVVLSSDGTSRVTVHQSGDPSDAHRVGTSAAQELLQQGAAELIERSRQS